MSRWKQLFDQMRAVESERLEARRRARLAEQTRADFDAWALSALGDVWRSIQALVEARARELELATGRRVGVEPRVSGVEGLEGLPALRILGLRLDSSYAYIYSHQVSGSPPHLHIAHWPAPGRRRRRHHRMMSMPICAVERADGEGWTLRRTAGPGREPVTVDDIVYRAFELLVCGRSRQPNDTMPYGSPE